MTLNKARPGRKQRAERKSTIDSTRNTRRYLVTSYEDGQETVEINTPDQKRARRVARSTAEAGVRAVLHQHVTHQGWKPIRTFEPTVGGA